MPSMRNVCFVGASTIIAQGFETLGCTVLYLPTPTVPFFNLAEALEEHDFVPDLVVQLESLGKRTILTGMDSVDCPVIFWAVDPHLNSHWHASYARLFDMTCSTQRAEIPQIKRRGAQDVRWMPTSGHDVSWTDMKDRAHVMAFVGRLSHQRPARQWMVEFLKDRVGEASFPVKDGLPFREMMELYQQSKIIPNESILGEVNFRTFEAASCGCLVLNPEIGDEQYDLFEPGREFDTYADVIELDAKLERYLSNDRLVQAMGRAARERVRAEHMPVHRAARFLEYAEDATRCRATGKDVKKWTALTVCSMWESGMVSLSAKEALAMLAPLEQDGDIAAAALRVQAVAGTRSLMEENIKTILVGKLYADSLDVNLAGSMAALRLENWDGAKTFWYRHLQSSGNSKQSPPTTPLELLSLWAKELKRKDRVFRGGFAFEPDRHLPATSMDCLVLALEYKREDVPTLRLIDAMLRSMPQLNQARVGFLSSLTLHERNDWRLAFEAGMANLRCFRLKAGIDELRLAHHLADEANQGRAFSMALSAMDRSGLITQWLERVSP